MRNSQFVSLMENYVHKKLHGFENSFRQAVVEEMAFHKVTKKMLRKIRLVLESTRTVETTKNEHNTQ
jgi:hypothetical protein